MKKSLENNKLLERGSIHRLFFKYAIPSLVTLTFFGFQNIIDGIIVGNFVGSDAMGSVNLIAPFYNILIVISMIIGIGCQTIFNISIGAKETQKAKDAMTTGFWALISIGLLMTILLFFFSADFVKLLGANDRLFPYAKAYLDGLMPFLIFITLCLYSDFMLKSMGSPHLSMIIMSSAVILNILLSLLFVIVFKMGTMGVSLATGTAFTLACFISGRITFNPKNTISMLKGRFSFKLLKNAIYNGSSEGTSELASATTILMMNLIIIKIAGADGVVAFTAINYINSLGTFVFLGISDGMIPVLSHNYGAKNLKRIRQIFNYIARINIILGLLIFIFLQLLGKLLINLFFDGNEGIRNMAVQGLYIYSFLFLINGLNILVTSFFTSVAQAKKSVIIAIFRGGIFIVLGILILPLFFKLNGVWATVPVAEALTLFISIPLFISFKNKYLR